jgi:hypothetical protein
MLAVAAAGALLTLAGPSFAQSMSPAQWLDRAQQEVSAHHRYRALQAIDSAEGELLAGKSALQKQSTRDIDGDPEVVRQMGRAREALEQGQWDQARTYIREAMNHPSVASSATTQ